MGTFVALNYTMWVLKKGEAGYNFIKYFFLLVSFVAGAAIEVEAAKRFGIKSIFIASAICGFMFMWEMTLNKILGKKRRSNDIYHC